MKNYDKLYQKIGQSINYSYQSQIEKYYNEVLSNGDGFNKLKRINL